jgi:CRP-like cAMP-binding protein
LNTAITTDELRSLEAAYQAATRRSEHAREARNTGVRRAIAQGWTHARIADATGLTRGRIGQIAQRRPL